MDWLILWELQLCLHYSQLKFLINLCAGASVLPLVSLFLGYGYTFSDLLTILSCLAIFVVISAYMLPKIKDNKPELKIA